MAQLTERKHMKKIIDQDSAVVMLFLLLGLPSKAFVAWTR